MYLSICFEWSHLGSIPLPVRLVQTQSNYSDSRSLTVAGNGTNPIRTVSSSLSTLNFPALGAVFAPRSPNVCRGAKKALTHWKPTAALAQSQ